MGKPPYVDIEKIYIGPEFEHCGKQFIANAPMVPVLVDLSNTWEQLPNTNTVSPNKYKIHKQNTNTASPNTKYTILYTNAVSPSIKYTISYTNTVQKQNTQ